MLVVGAAGLVGQNLLLKLKALNLNLEIVAVDKHNMNTMQLRKFHPDILVLEEDVTKDGQWQEELKSCDVVISLQAQIGSLQSSDFVANNIDSMQKIVESAAGLNVRFIHISSSVVESVADDDYTNTKRVQEEIVVNSGFEYCILRPTLMFGWFDRKHLGWLSRFMKRIPIFPIPGSGKYMRQPLYAGDFCDIIINCINEPKVNNIYNITGYDKIDYIDLIREIKKQVGSHTLIVKIPVFVFSILLKIYAIFNKNPPFTADQLEALSAGDEFEEIDWPKIFKVKSTPIDKALNETFNHPVYSKIELDF